MSAKSAQEKNESPSSSTGHAASSEKNWNQRDTIKIIVEALQRTNVPSAVPLIAAVLPAD